MKKFLALMMALVLTIGCFAACTKSNEADKPAEKVTVAIVSAGTFGDRSFYDSSKAGGDQLAKDFANVEIKERSQESQYRGTSVQEGKNSAVKA